MKNELCNRIDVFLAKDIQRIINNEIVLKNGKKGYSFITDDFSLTAKADQSDAGLLYNINETITADKQTDDIYDVFRFLRSAVFCLHTDKKKVIIGTTSLPGKIIVTNQLDKTQLQISCSCLKNPF